MSTRITDGTGEMLFGNCQSKYSDLRREGRITYANQIYSGDHGGDIL